MKMHKKASWKKVFCKLSKSYGKQKKFRNVSMIFAVAITAMFFTTLLTLFVGIEISLSNYDKKQTGTTAHAQVFELTKSEYELLAQDEQIKDSSYTQFIGTLEMKQVYGLDFYLYFSEEKAFSWEQKELIGEYPKKKNEVVLGTELMEQLGIEQEVGQKVTLRWNTMGTVYTDTFVLSGYYISEKLNGTNGTFAHAPGTYENIYLSKAYANVFMGKFTEKEIVNAFNSEKSVGEGLYQAFLYFPNYLNINLKIENLTLSHCSDIPELKVFLNEAYKRIDPFSISMGTYFFMAAVVFCIGGAGFFVIYSMFRISIVEDIRFFGLLQTLGVSKKQFFFFLRQQIYQYSVIGILIGEGIGYVLGSKMIPLILKRVDQGVSIYFPFQPWILCFCAILTFAAVYISCTKSARSVASFTPIEIAKLQEQDLYTKKKHKKGHSYTGTYKSNRFAWKNVAGNPKKTGTVVCSMVLLLILVMCAATFVNSIDYDVSVSKRMGDLTYGVFVKNYSNHGNMVEVSKYLDEMDEEFSISGNRIGCFQEGLILEEKYAPKEQENVFDTSMVEKYLSENELLDYGTSLEPIITHHIDLTIFGMDAPVISAMEIVDGVFDEKKYATGNYVLLTTETTPGELGGNKTYDNPLKALYKAGDKIKLYGKEYTVMATVELPKELYPTILINELPVIMPYQCAASLSDTFCTYGEVFTKNVITGNIEEKISKYISTEQAEHLEYSSKAIIMEQLKQTADMVFYISLVIVLFVGAILLIHVVNTTIFSVQNQRQTFAMLQSVGMQEKQQKTAVLWEYGIQAILAFLITLLVGSAFSLSFVKKFCETSEFCVYHYTIWPVIAVCVAIAIIMSVCALVSYQSIWKKYNVIELLKEE